MTDKKTRIAIIGCGRISEQHVKGFLDSGKAEIVALVAPRKFRADALVEEFGLEAQWFESHKAMLGSEFDVDAASISAPDYLHEPIVTDCARAGVHVLCEKPLALNAIQAERMRGAVSEAGVHHMVRFNSRFDPTIAWIRHEIRRGRLGRIYHFRSTLCVERTSNPDLPLEWRHERKRGGYGALSDLGCHLLDRAFFVLGSEAGVVQDARGSANIFIPKRRDPETGRTLPVSAYDAAGFSILFEGGVLAHFDVSRFAPGVSTTQIDGGKGSFRLSPSGEIEFHEKRVTDHQRPESEFVKAEVPADFREAGEWNLFGYFVQCIQEDRKPSPSFDDGVRCARVLDAVDRSIREAMSPRH